MLKATCCQNYTCRFCVDDMNQHLKKNPELDPRCLFCNTEDPRIIDVIKTEDIRQYSDSPYNTIKSDKKFITSFLNFKVLMLGLID